MYFHTPLDSEKFSKLGGLQQGYPKNIFRSNFVGGGERGITTMGIGIRRKINSKSKYGRY
jgi:hypothetical protein